jgi:zinc D-Ala-D-Ala carboxypeptidase
MKISNHISYEEAVYSPTAQHHGIENIPNQNQLIEMGLTAQNVFEPLRTHFGFPIYISSFFRSKALNTKIGGSRTSQHMANDGSAIDIDDNLGGATNIEMGMYIKDNLVFDTLIFEFQDSDGLPKWIHASYNRSNNRKQTFIAIRENDETIYLDFEPWKYLLGL